VKYVSFHEVLLSPIPNFVVVYFILFCSVVGIATRYGLDGPGDRVLVGAKDFVPSGPTPRSTEPPGIKRLERVATYFLLVSCYEWFGPV